MNKFLERKSVPAWRLVFWGMIAAAAVAGLGVFFHEATLVVAALFAGAFISGFGFLLNWSQTSQWVRSNLRLLIIIGVLGNILLFVWKLLDKK